MAVSTDSPRTLFTNIITALMYHSVGVLLILAKDCSMLFFSLDANFDEERSLLHIHSRSVIYLVKYFCCCCCSRQCYTMQLTPLAADLSTVIQTPSLMIYDFALAVAQVPVECQLARLDMERCRNLCQSGSRDRMPQVHSCTDVLIDFEVAGDKCKSAHVIPWPPGRRIRCLGISLVPR